MNGVPTDLPEGPQASTFDTYDVKEVLNQIKPSLISKTLAQFLQLHRTFSDVFKKSENYVGCCKLVQHKVDFYPCSKPSKLPNRQLRMHCRADSRQLTFSLNINSHSQYSPFCSQAVLDPRKIGELGIVIDYQQLKEANCQIPLAVIFYGEKSCDLGRKLFFGQFLTCHGVFVKFPR